MKSDAKLIARTEILSEYPSTHSFGEDWDNTNSTANHLFTSETTRLNKELGL